MKPDVAHNAAAPDGPTRNEQIEREQHERRVEAAERRLEERIRLQDEVERRLEERYRLIELRLIDEDKLRLREERRERRAGPPRMPRR
jgi:hypothetical protein